MSRVLFRWLICLPTDNSYEDWAGDLNRQLTTASAIYTSSMFAPRSVKGAPVDNRGNIKIPMIEQIPDAPTDYDDTRWHDVPMSNVTYSALLGLPTTKPPSDSDSTFTIETAYWVSACPVLRKQRDFNSTIRSQFK